MRNIFLLIILFKSLIGYSQFIYEYKSIEYLVLPIESKLFGGMEYKGKIRTPESGLTKSPDFISQLNKLVEKAKLKDCNIIRITDIMYISALDGYGKEECKLYAEAYYSNQYENIKKLALEEKRKFESKLPEIIIFRIFNKHVAFENFKYTLLIDSTSYPISKYSEYRQSLTPNVTHTISIPEYNINQDFEVFLNRKYYLSCYFKRPQTTPSLNTISIQLNGYTPTVNLIENEQLGEILYSKFKNMR